MRVEFWCRRSSTEREKSEIESPLVIDKVMLTGWNEKDYIIVRLLHANFIAPKKASHAKYINRGSYCNTLGPLNPNLVEFNCGYSNACAT